MRVWFKEKFTTKLERGSRRLVILESCAQSYLVVVLLIISTFRWVQNQKGRPWVNETRLVGVIFVNLSENSSVIKKSHPKISGKPPEKSHLVTTFKFRLLNTRWYSATRKYLGQNILKVTGQVWERPKKISININHSYYQGSSP